MNSQITDLALGAKCGGRGASGSPGAALVGGADARVQSRSASATQPKPAPARQEFAGGSPGRRNARSV